jgi:hypothetical protein
LNEEGLDLQHNLILPIITQENIDLMDELGMIIEIHPVQVGEIPQKELLPGVNITFVWGFD